MADGRAGGSLRTGLRPAGCSGRVTRGAGQRSGRQRQVAAHTAGCSPFPRTQGSREEVAGGGKGGARRGGLAGRRGPAFPLRIPGAMRRGDGSEPAGLAP